MRGRLNSKTQRVAFRGGEYEVIVAGTGIYNLTQNELPVLRPFGTDRVEDYLPVRLEQPDDDGYS